MLLESPRGVRIDASDAHAGLLIASGWKPVAAEPPEETPEPQPEPEPVPEPEPEPEAKAEAKAEAEPRERDLSGMTRDELLAVLEELGGSAPSRANKSQIVSAIREIEG